MPSIQLFFTPTSSTRGCVLTFINGDAVDIATAKSTLERALTLYSVLLQGEQAEVPYVLGQDFLDKVGTLDQFETRVERVIFTTDFFNAHLYFHVAFDTHTYTNRFDIPRPIDILERIPAFATALGLILVEGGDGDDDPVEIADYYRNYLTKWVADHGPAYATEDCWTELALTSAIPRPNAPSSRTKQ